LLSVSLPQEEEEKSVASDSFGNDSSLAFDVAEVNII